MENSTCSKNAIESSSWEWYIDHYMLLSEGKTVSLSNSDSQSNNRIGDATSYLLKELRLKRRRPLDDSLEDTASSPVDFSKIKEIHNLNAKTKKKEDAGLIFQMKTNAVIEDSRKHVLDEAHEVGNANETRCDCNALRKRGLCLVPLSMLIDYLG